jgi:hypothetical protein
MRVRLPLKWLSDLGSLRFTTLGIILTSIFPLGVTASADVPFVSLRLHKNESEVSLYRAYPEARVNMLFPSSEAWLEAEDDPRNLGLSASPIIERFRIFRLGDARHRFAVVAASVDGQLFVFDELYCRDNSPVMRQLIRVTHSAPHTKGEALDLVKLYLTLSYYRLDAPVKFVASRGSTLQHEGSSEDVAPFSDSIGVSHSPKIVLVRGVYTVDLFTFSKLGPAVGPVTHWRFRLSDSGFDEQMAAQHKGPEKPSTDETALPNKDEKDIKFKVDLMANGSTNDGATTDLQLWSASDGPTVSRTHYYYNSHEGAEKLMQDRLRNALAVLENSPSKNGDGENSGKQALIVWIDKDKKSLFASQLYEDERSVLEYSCSCLRSLLLSRDTGRSTTQH